MDQQRLQPNPGYIQFPTFSNVHSEDEEQYVSETPESAREPEPHDPQVETTKRGRRGRIVNMNESGTSGEQENFEMRVIHRQDSQEELEQAKAKKRKARTLRDTIKLEVIHDGVIYDNEEIKQGGEKTDDPQESNPLEGRDTAFTGGKQSRAEQSIGNNGSTAYMSGAGEREEPGSPTPGPTLRSMTMGVGASMMGMTEMSLKR